MSELVWSDYFDISATEEQFLRFARYCAASVVDLWDCPAEALSYLVAGGDEAQRLLAAQALEDAYYKRPVAFDFYAFQSAWRAIDWKELYPDCPAAMIATLSLSFAADADAWAKAPERQTTSIEHAEEIRRRALVFTNSMKLAFRNMVADENAASPVNAGPRPAASGACPEAAGRYPDVSGSASGNPDAARSTGLSASGTGLKTSEGKMNAAETFAAASGHKD